VTHEVVLPFCHPEYSTHRTNFRGTVLSMIVFVRLCLVGPDRGQVLTRSGGGASLAGRCTITRLMFSANSWMPTLIGGASPSPPSWKRTREVWVLHSSSTSTRGYHASIFTISAAELSAFITSVDNPLKQFLEEVTLKHPNTFVLLLSDHGSHMGPYFRYTAAGVLENR
jgi:hypothetical protein